MEYKCPRCGGTAYYIQQVQTGNRVYDFNPTDSTDVSNDLIPNSMQVPGQVFVDPVMKQVAFCKTCPSPVQMYEIKPPRKPAPAGWWYVWFAFVVSAVGLPYVVNSRGFLPGGLLPIAVSIGLIVKGCTLSRSENNEIDGKVIKWSIFTLIVILTWTWLERGYIL